MDPVSSCTIHGDLMNRVILIVLLAVGLAACTPPKRTGPLAPIITAGRPAPRPPHPKPKPPAPPPKKELTKVYPYRPPASAPKAPAPWGTAPVRESHQAKTSPVSEPATKSISKQGARTRSAKVPSKGTTSVPQAVISASALPSPPGLSPAASTLIKQARQQRQAGDYVAAAANLERALGIQPLEPYVWNRLARIRMEQGRYAQARHLASRSNALAGGKRSALTRDNRNIIAAVDKATGNAAKLRPNATPAVAR